MDNLREDFRNWLVGQGIHSIHLKSIDNRNILFT